MTKSLIALLSITLLHGEEKGTLLFEDDFERNESQEKTEEIGKGWASNSKKRAKGNKQVDLKDGAMHIAIHPEADHAVSVTHEAKFKNGRIDLRFKLENKDDSLGLNFADLGYKKVHAGHLCVTRIGTSSTVISDLKTGVMDLKIRELRLAKKVTPTLVKLLQNKTQKFPHKLEPGKWHKLSVRIYGNVMSVTINDKEVGKLTSTGIGHPTKKMLRLSVKKEAIVDDVKIYSLGPKPPEKQN